MIPRFLVRTIAAALFLFTAADTGSMAQTSRSQDTAIRIRITAGDAVILATLDSNATARDFAAMLPLTLSLEDYAATEKIGYLPRKLSTEGAPDAVTPATGDIAYYAPWGNLALFHRDFRNSPGLIRLGRITQGVDALRIPGKRDARIEIAN
jgi:hypothetical protein